jgi:hypothetical protein
MGIICLPLVVVTKSFWNKQEDTVEDIDNRVQQMVDDGVQ